MAENAQTIEITNFGGKLTRIRNGDMNSGFCKFNTSWGYDPFTKPMNLTWLEQPNDITGPITDLPLAAKPRFESNVQYVYAVGSSGNLYKINPNPQFGNSSILTADSVIGISSVKNSTSFNYGASMDFFGDNEKIFVGHDQGVNSINFDGSSETKIGTNSLYVQNVARPVKQFSGKILFANGPTFGAIDSTGTVTSSVISTGISSSIYAIYSQVVPPFGPEIQVRDIDVSPDFNYAYLSAAESPTENIMTSLQDRGASASNNGFIFQWNGSDVGTTAGLSIPSFAVQSLQTYLQNNYFFSNDAFGAALNNGTQKILTLTGNKYPLPNATGVNGNFIFWVCPETVGTTRVVSLYYYGSLDSEMQPGLFRLMRYTPSSANSYQAPLAMLVDNTYQSLNNSTSSVATISYGKHYFSTYDLSNGTASYKLQSFYVSPSGFGAPQLGTYETQTQLFSKRITVKQIRVYSEPTAIGNGLQIDCVGSDDSVITNGTFTYSFVAGTDITKLQGTLERIDFNPAMKDTFALGLRVTNTGTTNMIIKKIEVDYNFSGK